MSSGHGHSCAHGHHHHGGHHSHAPATRGRAFALGIGLNLAFVGAEVFYGLSANSMALLADAGHNLGDVLGLALSWAAIWMAARPPTAAHTYGHGRGSIMAALVNALTLAVAVGGIAWGAVHRLLTPAAVEPGVVMGVAALGILINSATALMFLRGREEDVNVRAAFLHMAYDAAVSLGVVISGWLMSVTGKAWIDPVVSLCIVAVMMREVVALLRHAIGLSMDAVPPGIDRKAVEVFLRQLPGVTAVHDLHIWPISTSATALTVHLVCPQGHPGDAWLFEAVRALEDRFGIAHATVQVEQGTIPGACKLESDAVV